MSIYSSDKLYFSIPDFWGRYGLNLSIIDLMQQHPEYFKDNIVIDSCYGSFPGLIWNGGRGLSGQIEGYNNVLITLEEFNKRGISIRLAFNSSGLDQLKPEQYVNDYLCNRIMEISNELNVKYKTHNGCTIGSEVLGEHIKRNFPDFQIIWSTTLENENIDFLNNKSKDDMLVIPYGMNKKFNKLKELTHPENIEVLVIDEGCVDDCPIRKEHYLATSNSFLLLPTCGRFETNGFCQSPNRSNNYYYEQYSTRKYVIQPNELDDYAKISINKFKISGRTIGDDMVINTIENYVRYLIIDEKRDYIRNKLLVDFFGGAQ